LRLMFSRFGQMHCRCLRLLRSGSDLHGGLVDRLHQTAQRLDRKVDRVRDRAGNFFGNGRLDGKIAFRKRAHFIEQAQNRFLVALIVLLLTAQALVLFAP